MSKVIERCAGIDIGKRFLLCCALTGAAAEEPQSETLRFEATVAALQRLREWLARKKVTHVVMESTGSYWIPVFNILEDHFVIVLANPEEVKNRKGHKTDRKDAEHLADLLGRQRSHLCVHRLPLQNQWRVEEQGWRKR
jgi:transposase